MKRQIAVVVILLLTAIGFVFFITGGKRSDIVLNNYNVSEDGSIMTINVGVASSMGYVRTLKVKEDGDNMYITFYQTYGMNSRIGAKNEFQIDLNPSCKGIYFYRGDDGYALVLQKDDETKEWNLKR
ncbi:MAG: hypothetical protein AAGU76_18315 [Sedimentibacter sp.]|uniref:hypothetical protein n=1 Tax=Sedimentibacter sp. TaxID=1960295 RepID=UPI0031594E28